MWESGISARVFSDRVGCRLFRKLMMKISPSTPLLNFQGKTHGPSFLITVGIHGNETGGIHAVNSLIADGFFQDLPIGNVSVLLANPTAFEQGKRFIEQNMNRCVCPEQYNRNDIHECDRASLIADMITKSDVYLDLHSTSARTPSFALPADNRKSEKLAGKLPVDYVVKKLIHTTASRCTTIDWALKHGKTAIAVECGQHNDNSTKKIAMDVIRSVILDSKAIQKPVTLESTKNVIVGKEFRFARKFKAFSYVLHDDLVAFDDSGEIRCPYPEGAYIIMPTAMPVEGEEAWFWGKRP